jgi:hypothetical protein
MASWWAVRIEGKGREERPGVHGRREDVELMLIELCRT